MMVTGASTGSANAADGARDLERIARSGEVLAKSGSAKFRGTITADVRGADWKVVFDGRFDFASRGGEYSVDAEAIALQGNGKVRTLLVGGIVYLGLDGLALGTQVQGKRWLRVDPAVFGEGQIGQTDPNGGLDILRGVTGRVEEQGTERVRGRRTTRYRVTIDPARAVSKAPQELRDVVRGAVRHIGSKATPADVWLDDRGRVRKLRLRVGTGSLTSPKGSVGFEYYALGATVNVNAPPAEEILDFGEVLGGDAPASARSPRSTIATSAY